MHSGSSTFILVFAHKAFAATSAPSLGFVFTFSVVLSRGMFVFDSFDKWYSSHISSGRVCI